MLNHALPHKTNQQQIICTADMFFLLEVVLQPVGVCSPQSLLPPPCQRCQQLWAVMPVKRAVPWLRSGRQRMTGQISRFRISENRPTAATTRTDRIGRDKDPRRRTVAPGMEGYIVVQQFSSAENGVLLH